MPSRPNRSPSPKPGATSSRMNPIDPRTVTNEQPRPICARQRAALGQFVRHLRRQRDRDDLLVLVQGLGGEIEPDIIRSDDRATVENERHARVVGASGGRCRGLIVQSREPVRPHQAGSSPGIRSGFTQLTLDVESVSLEFFHRQESWHHALPKAASAARLSAGSRTSAAKPFHASVPR